MYGQHPVWEAVHERLFLAFPLLAAAALLARIRLEPWWSAALSVTVTGVRAVSSSDALDVASCPP
jgi:hypothetical protein